MTDRSRRLPRWALSAVALTVLLSVPPARAAEDESRDESWQVIYIGNQRVGWARSSIREVERDGRTLVESSTDTHMVFKRFGQTLRMETSQTTLETEDGDLISFVTEMRNPPASTTTTVGRVEGDQLVQTTTINGQSEEKTSDWDPEVKSPAYQERVLAEDPLKPGDTRTFKTFVPELNQVTEIEITAGNEKEVELLDGETHKLLAVTIRQSILPTLPMEAYLDQAGDVLKSETNLFGMTMTTYAVSEEEALREIEGEELDVAVTTLVKVEPIEDAHETTRIVYHVTSRSDSLDDLLKASQTHEVRQVDDDTLELVVVAFPIPDESDKSEPPKPEFLEPSTFLQCDDGKVAEHADKAAGDETDPGAIARRMEKYVHDTLTEKNFSTALASAAEVAEDLQGDCTEHAVLLAAMLRAKGIPSRVAVGLVYADSLQAFGGHMWTEAFLDGRWIPLDATLGRGGIGGAHIKLADSSFSDDAPAPVTSFLPLLDVLGKMEIDVIETK